MNMKRITGRQKEISRLDRCMQSDSAQLMIVYGRRRVGKTFLIDRYFDNQFDFKLTGAFQQPKAVQLKNFTAELNRQTGQKIKPPKDWTEAFMLLRDYLSSLPTGRKQIVFFDELPWMDTARSGFLSALEWFWNDWGCTRDQLIFIVCGSATAWMTDKIAHNKGGLFNRQTCKLFLEPFTLAECEMYLASRDIHWSRYDIAECYMVLGGIPYYLSLLDPELSCRQNMDELLFNRRGELWDEFTHLYRTLFSNSDQYIRLVEALSQKRGGLTREEIIRKTKIAANGVLSKMLEDLANSGFVRRVNTYGQKKHNAHYQLADYYTIFYLRFLKENDGRDGHFWSNALDNPSLRAWLGLTFEQLCMDHLSQIRSALGIEGVLSESSVWSSRGDESEDSRGAQIDLLIDRRDRTVNLCEIKFSVNEYEIDRETDQNLRNKIEAFRNETNCRKTIQLTMITTFGVKKNMYSSLVTNQIVLDDLFR